MSVLPCPSCFEFQNKKDSECIRCSAVFFSEIETYNDFCDATAMSLQGALAPWITVVMGSALWKDQDAFLSSLAAVNRRGFLTSNFQAGEIVYKSGPNPNLPLLEQNQWVQGWLPKALGQSIYADLQENDEIGVYQITNPPQREVEATCITFYEGKEDTWISNQTSFEDVLENINPAIADIVSTNCMELSVWDPVIGRNTVLFPTIMDLLEEYLPVQFSGGALARQVRPRFPELEFSKPAFPKAPYSSFYLPERAGNPASVLQNAGRLIKDLIFSRHEIAEDWTLCFEDKTKGELVVGYRPGGDREVQIKKVKACLRAANLSIPPMRVEPFRATRGNGRRTRSTKGTRGLTMLKDCKSGAGAGGFRCDPFVKLVGGVAILVEREKEEKEEEPGYELGTICIVTNTNDTEGFVTAGHVVSENNIPVFQGERRVGSSTEISNFHTGTSDSAFVAFQTEITGIKNIVLSKKRTYEKLNVEVKADIEHGTRVYMAGATRSKAREGPIVATDATLRFDDEGVLEKQYLADYRSNEGDSGGPVYTTAGDLIGLNVGAATKQDLKDDFPSLKKSSYAIISKWASVVADLGLTL